MVHEEKLPKKVIAIENGVFDVQKVYSGIHDELVNRDYDFVEKKQESKTTKYGQEILFTLFGSKEIDEFARVEIIVDCRFDDINRVKSKEGSFDKGSANLLFNCKVVLDYQNKWESSFFSRYLFVLYREYLKKKFIDDHYMEPTNSELLSFYRSIKGLFGLHK